MRSQRASRPSMRSTAKRGTSAILESLPPLLAARQRAERRERIARLADRIREGAERGRQLRVTRRGRVEAVEIGEVCELVEEPGVVRGKPLLAGPDAAAGKHLGRGPRQRASPTFARRRPRRTGVETPEAHGKVPEDASA